jgi:hypothetical protein
MDARFAKALQREQRPNLRALSGAQFHTVLAAAQQLQQRSRETFLREVASCLSGYDAPGDGDVARVVRDALKHHHDELSVRL